MTAQFHMDPETYLDAIRAEVPRYDQLQGETIAAIPREPRRVLELGVGTGETTRRLLERYPKAEVTGLDSQPEMVFKARELGIEVRLARMEDPLPDGPWDLVISVLSIHHLTGERKRDLFRRVRCFRFASGCLARLSKQGRSQDVRIEVETVEHPRGAIGPFDRGQGEGDVLDTDMPMSQIQRLTQSALEDVLGPAREWDMPASLPTRRS